MIFKQQIIIEKRKDCLRIWIVTWIWLQTRYFRDFFSFRHVYFTDFAWKYSTLLLSHERFKHTRPILIFSYPVNCKEWQIAWVSQTSVFNNNFCFPVFFICFHILLLSLRSSNFINLSVKLMKTTLHFFNSFPFGWLSIFKLFFFLPNGYYFPSRFGTAELCSEAFHQYLLALRA